MQPTNGIDEFNKDDMFWRVVLFGGVSFNPAVPSEPYIEVLLASLPDGVDDPYSSGAMRNFSTRQARIGVGQLPYVTIGSVWHRGRPQPTNSAAAHHICLHLDTRRIRYVSLSELSTVIPKERYAFGGNWPFAATTQFAAIEVNGDPYAVLIPVIELIRFYYASSTRLSQALFWGEYAKSINSQRCGQIVDGPYRVHLRKWMRDSDAWILARFHASKEMQEEVKRLYKGMQFASANGMTAYPAPFRDMKCGFPFLGMTTIEAVHVPLPNQSGHSKRVLLLRLLRCSAPFPFDQLLCDRDNRNLKGVDSGEDELETGWRRRIDLEDKHLDEWGNDPTVNLHSDGEPLAGLSPLEIAIREDRFSFLDGKQLLKEQPERQRYRTAPMVGGQALDLTGFGTGSGIWSSATRKPAEVNVKQSEKVNTQTLEVSLTTFFEAMRLIGTKGQFKIRYVSRIANPLLFSERNAAVGFPTIDPRQWNKPINWARAKTGKSWRARQVVVAEVRTDAGVCYVLEGQRVKSHDKLSVLIIADLNFRELSRDRLGAFLLDCAIKNGWLSADKMPEYRRATTPHKGITSADTLATRIERKICEVMGIDLERGCKDKPTTTELTVSPENVELANVHSTYAST